MRWDVGIWTGLGCTIVPELKLDGLHTDDNKKLGSDIQTYRVLAP